MKRMLFCFLLGVGAGAGGYWYLQQEAGKAQLEQARSQVVSNAQRFAGAIKDKIGEFTVDDVKQEMARTSMVVREKAKTAGQSIADATRSEEHTSELQSQSNLVCRL